MVAVTATSIAAFAPVQNQGPVVARASSALRQVVASADVKAKNEAALDKLKAKDAGSHAISKDVSLVLLVRSMQNVVHVSWSRRLTH